MGAAALKPERSGEWLSESEIAKRVGLHRQTVAARLEDLGYEPDEERSTPKKNVHWFDAEMQFAIKAAKDSLSAAKIRDLRAGTALKELKLAEARGELVSMAEATEDLHAVVNWIFQEFTARQPKRIVAKLTKAKNAVAVRKILKTDTDTIMKNLRMNFEKLIDG